VERARAMASLEEQRNERVARNKRRLDELGINNAAEKLQSGRVAKKPRQAAAPCLAELSSPAGRTRRLTPPTPACVRLQAVSTGWTAGGSGCRGRAAQVRRSCCRRLACTARPTRRQLGLASNTLAVPGRGWAEGRRSRSLLCRRRSGRKRAEVSYAEPSMQQLLEQAAAVAPPAAAARGGTSVRLAPSGSLPLSPPIAPCRHRAAPLPPACLCPRFPAAQPSDNNPPAACPRPCAALRSASRCRRTHPWPPPPPPSPQASTRQRGDGMPVGGWCSRITLSSAQT
jgi:hypothetical protein